MAQKTVFHFDDYKAFILYMEQTRGAFERGFRTRLAEKAGCRNAFVSQVLNTGAHFSLEQALSIAKHLDLNEVEQRYFLLLVEAARSGTEELQKHFQKQMQELRDEHLSVGTRTQAGMPPELTHPIYYSQWFYSAIHIIVSIPRYRTVAAISDALNISRDVVEKVVIFLLAHGMIVKKGSELRPGPTLTILDPNSPEVIKHTVNYRIAAIRSVEDRRKSDFHFSFVSALSKKDSEILAQKCSDLVVEYVKESTKSAPNEVLYCFNLDFFNVVK